MSAGIRVHLWTVSIRNATWCQPHRLRSHPDHQAGVALPLGRGPRLHLHAGDHRHLFRHRHLCPVQWHAHRASVRAGDELRPADGNLPVLRHHVPDDCHAGCGSVLVQEDFLGLGDVFQLCCTAHQDQQDTPHLWTREEVCNGTQVMTAACVQCTAISMSVIELKVAATVYSQDLTSTSSLLSYLPSLFIIYFSSIIHESHELTLT